MTQWEKIHGKIISVSEIDQNGNLKVTTDKTKAAIQWQSVLKKVSSIDYWYYVDKILSSIKFIAFDIAVPIILIAIGLKCAEFIVKLIIIVEKSGL